jgi:hypothetical protein
LDDLVVENRRVEVDRSGVAFVVSFVAVLRMRNEDARVKTRVTDISLKKDDFLE